MAKKVKFGLSTAPRSKPRKRPKRHKKSPNKSEKRMGNIEENKLTLSFDILYIHYNQKGKYNND